MYSLPRQHSKVTPFRLCVQFLSGTAVPRHRVYAWLNKDICFKSVFSKYTATKYPIRVSNRRYSSLTASRPGAPSTDVPRYLQFTSYINAEVDFRLRLTVNGAIQEPLDYDSAICVFRECTREIECLQSNEWNQFFCRLMQWLCHCSHDDCDSAQLSSILTQELQSLKSIKPRWFWLFFFCWRLEKKYLPLLKS